MGEFSMVFKRVLAVDEALLFYLVALFQLFDGLLVLLDHLLSVGELLAFFLTLKLVLDHG
jgi:hypothetical protein